MQGLQLIVIGSGSAGNATLLHLNGETLLIDAGLSPRRTHRACRDLGWPAPSHILLTHPDSDHLYRTWSTFTNRGDVTLHMHQHHVPWARAAGFEMHGIRTFEDTCQVAGVMAQVHLAAHDDHGTCAFVMTVDGVRIGWATDLGAVPQSLLQAFADVDLLAIESNYDRAMQEASDRPEFLKARIMGGNGHLSNRQALDAVCTIAQTAPLEQIILLHLSRQCNCPNRINALWQDHAPHLADRLLVTHQHEWTRVRGLSAVAN